MLFDAPGSLCDFVAADQWLPGGLQHREWLSRAQQRGVLLLPASGGPCACEAGHITGSIRSVHHRMVLFILSYGNFVYSQRAIAWRLCSLFRIEVHVNDVIR